MMPVRVVDGFEAVKIAQGQGQRPAIAHGPADFRGNWSFM
jgi:hypothetical protein